MSQMSVETVPNEPVSDDLSRKIKTPRHNNVQGASSSVSPLLPVIYGASPVYLNPRNRSSAEPSYGAKEGVAEMRKQYRSMQAAMRNMNIESKLKDAKTNSKYATVDPANIAYHEIISSHPAVNGTKIAGMVTKLESKLKRKEAQIRANPNRFVAVYSYKKPASIKNKNGTTRMSKPRWSLKIVSKIQAGFEKNKKGEYFGTYQKATAFATHPIASLPQNKKPMKPQKGVVDPNRKAYMDMISNAAKTVGAPRMGSKNGREYVPVANNLFINVTQYELDYMFGDFDNLYGGQSIQPPSQEFLAI